jgi:sodium-coupled neutral amino acid transporter 11
MSICQLRKIRSSRSFVTVMNIDLLSLINPYYCKKVYYSGMSLVGVNPENGTDQETTPLAINKSNNCQVVSFTTKTSLFLSIFNLINDVTSPSTVNLPQFFTQAGVYLTVLLLCIFGVITAYTLCILYHLSNNHKKSNYPDLVKLAFGNIGYVLTCLFMFLYNFGSLLSAFLMFGGVVPELIYYLIDGHYFVTSRTMILIYITLLLLPVVFKKELGEFAIFSFLCISSVIGIAISLFVLAVQGTHYDPPPSDPYRFAHSRALSALGGLSFIFMCHDLSFNVFGGLRDPTPRRYFTVVVCSMSLVIGICAVMGISGYLLFFNLNLNDGNVLNLLPQSTAVGIVARLLLTLDLTLSIPYQTFMPRAAITSFFMVAAPSLFTTKFRKNIFHYVATLFIIGLALIIAIFVTDIGIVTDLTGSVSASSLAYMVPGLLVLRLEKGFSVNKIGALAVFFVGLSIFICSMSSIIYFQFINTNKL